MKIEARLMLKGRQDDDDEKERNESNSELALLFLSRRGTAF